MQKADILAHAYVRSCGFWVEAKLLMALGTTA
jgi:hypothetical protein